MKADSDGMAGKPKHLLVLTDDERLVLHGWASRRKTAQGLALRARMVLLSADGRPDREVARMVGRCRDTVGHWRRRFLRDRLGGLTDEPRSGTPRTITDAQVEEVIVKTLEENPADTTHWSRRELAQRVDMSASSIRRIWKAFGLGPHKVEYFKISTDPMLRWWTRSATWSGCTWTRPRERWCSQSTRSRRSRR